MSTLERIQQQLAVLAPESLEIVDESSKHAGHEGAKSGGGHYWITIVSRQFQGKSTMARHRMVYTALSGMMSQEIHALSIKACTPEELT
ncbi:MAG TPA: BolA family protein [Burkholderiales bacterium]|nr:BolA family protein [Burkholderiales bacterium]